MNKLIYLMEIAKRNVWLFLLFFSISLSAASISGRAWNDVNGDGVRQASESGMSGVYINLEDTNGTLLAWKQTSNNGSYSFTNIAAGTYVIKFANPGSMYFMSPLNVGNSNRDNDADPFGYTQPITLSGSSDVTAIDGGFNMLGACFTPITAQIGSVTCDYNGTVSTNDDIATFDATFDGGTGAWGWDYAPTNLMMQPYGVASTFTVNVMNGVASVTVNDHDNTFCTATVTATCPAPTGTLIFFCDDDLIVYTDPGLTTASPIVTPPPATSTCPIGTVTVTQISGLTSNFPVGTSTVCFEAKDDCGNAETCCYDVIVKEPCDTKMNGDIIWDLLGTSLDANGYPTYKMRVTNNRNRALRWVAFQIPNGVVAKSPAQGSMYTAPSGNQYTVRNPNYSPFYSIRFATKGTGIKMGESDIFCYSLPKQANPWYINTKVRIESKTYFEAHLNTWDCMPMPIVNSPTRPVSEPTNQRDGLVENGLERSIDIYPNPATTQVWVNVEAFDVEEMLSMRMINTTGQVVVDRTLNGGNIQEVALPTGISAGLYFIQVSSTTGEQWTKRIMVR